MAQLDKVPKRMSVPIYIGRSGRREGMADDGDGIIAAYRWPNRH